MNTNFAVNNDPRFDTATWEQAIGPLPTPVDQSPIIFLDPVNGSDASNGQNGAVRTFTKAVEEANTFSDPTISIVGDSSVVDMDADAIYRANVKITVTGPVTTDLTSSVVTATVEATYEVTTVITVSDDLTGLTLLGKTLMFTSGAFAGQSFVINSNTAGSITIVGDAAAAATDAFTVTTSLNTLRTNGNNILQNNWCFTNIILGETNATDILIGDCESCISLIGCNVNAALNSKKYSLIEMEGCYVLNTIESTTVVNGFGGAWWIQNTRFDNDLTFEFNEVKFKNVWFENSVITANNSDITYTNSRLEDQGLVIENQTNVIMENFFINYTVGGSAIVLLRFQGKLLVCDNVRFEGNPTSRILEIRAEGALTMKTSSLELANSTTPAQGILVIDGGEFHNLNSPITLFNDYGSGIAIEANSLFDSAGPITFSGGTYTTLFVFGPNSRSFIFGGVDTTGITTGSYIGARLNATVNMLSAGTFTGATGVGIDVTTSTLVISGTFNATSVGVGLNLLANANVSFPGVNGSIVSTGDTAVTTSQSRIFIDPAVGFTLTGTATDLELNDGSNASIRYTNLTITNDPTGIVIGANAASALPATPTFTTDYGAGTPEGVTASFIA